jgi:hypothetical protein
MKEASLRMQFGVHYMRSSVILFRYNSYKPKSHLCVQFWLWLLHKIADEPDVLGQFVLYKTG